MARGSLVVAVLLLVGAAGVVPVAAGEATPVPVPAGARRLTAILVAATNAPLRVRGSDGLDHLEYDLVVTNTFPVPVTLTVVDVLGADDRSLLRLEGSDLTAVTQPLTGAAPTTAIAPAAAAAVLVDVAVPPGEVPARLDHRIAYEVPADAPAAALTASRRVNGPELAVDPRHPVMISPPLSGPGWLNANSCCDALSIHRSGRNVVDGARFAKPETFAIDWVQGRDGRFFDGDGSANEEWFGHGAEVSAAAPGTVVFVRDGLAEGTPYRGPAAIAEAADLGGNQVIVRIAPDVWAFYAHLQPGSVAVAVGDEVETGQPLGRLGNSGNSFAPHLHFGLLDGPGPMTANSVPFVLDRYTLVGAVPPEDWGLDMRELRVEGTPRTETASLPLNLTVTDFP
jgi:hypothetical protein